MNLNAFKTIIINAWNLMKNVTANQLQPNMIAFIFEDEADYNKILNLSWSFRGVKIIIQK